MAATGGSGHSKQLSKIRVGHQQMKMSVRLRAPDENLKASTPSSRSVDSPEGWAIIFEREHNGTTWQVCGSLSPQRRLICRLSVASEASDQEAAEQHLRSRAIQWIREHELRAA